MNFSTAIAVLGCMYERLGRMMGRSYEETVQILIKSLKQAESQTRAEIMVTLDKVNFIYKKYIVINLMLILVVA